MEAESRANEAEDKVSTFASNSPEKYRFLDAILIYRIFNFDEYFSMLIDAILIYLVIRA